MKILKITISATFFLISAPDLLAQYEIYNEKPKTENTYSNANKINETDFDNYYTERDYNAKVNGAGNKNKRNYNVDEYDEKDHRNRNRNNDVAVQVAAEIVFDVFINTVFIVATFWN